MSSKTTYYCDFCEGETPYENLTSIQGEIWLRSRPSHGHAATRKTLIDFTEDYYEICPDCKEVAIAQLAPFIHFMGTKGDILGGVDAPDENPDVSESESVEVSGDAVA